MGMVSLRDGCLPVQLRWEGLGEVASGPGLIALVTEQQSGSTALMCIYIHDMSTTYVDILELVLNQLAAVLLAGYISG